MARPKFDIAVSINNLIEYAKSNLYLRYEDSIYAKNQLLALFNVTEPSETVSNKQIDIQAILDPIVKYAVKNDICMEEKALLFETMIMGLVTPAPSAIIDNFDMIASTKSIKDATDYLAEVSVKSNYIRMVDINKNIKWTAPGSLGNLTITINLSKPEKDNKQVLLEKNSPKAKYPKCMLCVENIGFNGTFTHPARQTLRAVPITLNNEDWYMQFSPYVYYDNHIIAFSKEHKPMAITNETFTKLLDFVELFPHYFLGSNADLPIVGGSILAHDHYQGGAKVLPMFKRTFRKELPFADFRDTKVGILDWYNSVVRISGHNREEIETIAQKILLCWRNYTDESVGILASTDAPHNTITPIGSYDENDGYRLDLILRNNRTDEQHPYGIYHPTEDMHNIKKEGIGLIEAMGIFILPGRLKRETEGIISLLTSKATLNLEEIADKKHPLNNQINFITSLANSYGTSLSDEDAEQKVVEYINDTCIKILECTGVFKNTEIGQTAFENFINTALNK